jgi:hypothetical protein
VRACHVRRNPGFVDEDELGKIKVELIIEPLLTLFQDVETALLYRVASPFYESGRAGQETGAKLAC